MGACARNMWSDSVEIKPAQCCIKLVFHLTYTMMHGSTKLKLHVCVRLFVLDYILSVSFSACLSLRLSVSFSACLSVRLSVS